VCAWLLQHCKDRRHKSKIICPPVAPIGKTSLFPTSFHHVPQAGGDVYGSEEPLQPTPELLCTTLAPVLAALTMLRRLWVADFIFVSPGELWRALGCITGLQDLRLTFCQVGCPSTAPPPEWSIHRKYLDKPSINLTKWLLNMLLKSFRFFLLSRKNSFICAP
jgi:hypothetical protein